MNIYMLVIYKRGSAILHRDVFSPGYWPKANTWELRMGMAQLRATHVEISFHMSGVDHTFDDLADANTPEIEQFLRLRRERAKKQKRLTVQPEAGAKRGN